MLRVCVERRAAESPGQCEGDCGAPAERAPGQGRGPTRGLGWEEGTPFPEPVLALAILWPGEAFHMALSKPEGRKWGNKHIRLILLFFT